MDPNPTHQARTRDRDAAEARFRKQAEVRRHQLQQMEEAAAWWAAERTRSRQGLDLAAAEEERARFLEVAGSALAQAEADGTPTYPLRRTIHAALYPAPLSAATVKPKVQAQQARPKKGHGAAAATRGAKKGEQPKAPSAG